MNLRERVKARLLKQANLPDTETIIRTLLPNFRGLPPRSGESLYDRELRLNRASDLLKAQASFIKKNPLSLAYGDPFKAMKTLQDMQHNQGIMGQFKQAGYAESFSEKLKRLRLAAYKGDASASKELAQMARNSAAARARNTAKRKAIEPHDKIHKILGESTKQAAF